MPIIIFGASGAGAFIRIFGPESMGGAGDIGAKSDAEVARTGLSADEIDSKVHYLVSCFQADLSDLVSKDILPYRRETHSDPWPSRNVRPRIFTAEGMTYLS